MAAVDLSALSRRALLTWLAGASGMAVAGCVPQQPQSVANVPARPRIPSSYRLMYGPIPQARFPIPAVDLTRVPRRFWRREVTYPSSQPVGTLIVDTDKFFLYLIQENGKAIRYGVGLGRAGFGWKGEARIHHKTRWPTWTPPAEMIAREPELARYSAANGGMPPGLMNPLGARALYIFEDGVDTLYRVHGSPEYWSIGKAVSSGCVRLMNQDIIDLYRRVTPGSKIFVR